jgi:hypothetical protein
VLIDRIHRDFEQPNCLVEGNSLILDDHWHRSGVAGVLDLSQRMGNAFQNAANLA